MRALMAQTKLGASPGVILTNQQGFSSTSGVLIAGNAGGGSYQARYRSTESSDANSSFAYPSPDSRMLDAIADATTGVSQLRLDAQPPITGAPVTAGSISNAKWSLGSFGSGATPHHGIIWGSIMTAEEPDPEMWEIGARQWLSDIAMGGILAI